jgi:predicted ATP-grasp superfamily ATP-dependent carboligase
MKLLVFEFANATGVEDPSITAEGSAMLYGMLDDLRKFQTHHLVPAGYEPIKNCLSQSVTLQGDIKEWLQRNVKDYDACLPIAPEGDELLHELTLIIEEQGVEVLGSSSNAVRITTNKFDTYNALKDNVPVINTEQVYFNSSNKNNDYMEYLRSQFKNNLPKIVKPADGVSCLGVRLVNSFKEFMTAHDDLNKLTQLPYFIIQDYIFGINVSVSLLSDGESTVPLSLNFQEVHLKSGNIDYSGGKVPFKHELSEIAMETAKNAVESIDGLKGYVGVDMILDENDNKVHIVEINSRLTTPYVALRKIINFNLGEAIINSVHGELPSEVKLNGKAKFYKEDKNLRISVIK